MLLSLSESYSCTSLWSKAAPLRLSDSHSGSVVHWALRIIHVDARGYSKAVESSVSASTAARSAWQVRYITRPKSRTMSESHKVAWATSEVSSYLNLATLEYSKCYSRANHTYHRGPRYRVRTGCPQGGRVLFGWFYH